MSWVADYPDPDNFLRLKFHQAADRLLMGEAGVIPLTYERNHGLLKPWVKRYPVAPIKTTYFKDIIIEPH